MSDLINARLPNPTPPPLPASILLSAHQVATLCRQLREDLARDTKLERRLARAGQDTTHVARRIAATRESLLEVGEF